MPRTFLALIALLLFPTSATATTCKSVVWTQSQAVSGYTNYVENFETIDYDHDGKLDLVGTIRDNQAMVTLYAWRGLGNGTFEPAISLGTTTVIDIEIGNVNNDAYLDLVGGSNSKLWVRLGNATGFDPAIETQINFHPYDVHVVDLGGDNYTDLLVSSFTSNLFALYQGTGSGTYSEVRRQDAGATTFDVTGSVMKDFDNDGRLDVAVSRRSSEQLAVYFRNLDGSFAAPVVMGVGTFPNDIQSADLNEDGLPDLVSTEWEDGVVDVFLNLGGRAFAPRVTINGSRPGRHGGLDSFRLADVNGDTHVDILAGGINGDWVATFLGVGNGTFASGSWYSTPGSILAIATGDFDGDLDVDLALGMYGMHNIALNTCATQINLYSVSPVITSGQSAPLRAEVAGISSATPLPRGTITFKEGATTLGTADVAANGVASLNVAGLTLGDHTITAEFSGNSELAAATSSSIVQKVTNEATTTTIVLPPQQSAYGTPYPVNVEIRRQNGTTFFDYYMLNLDGIDTEYWNGSAASLLLTPGQHTLIARFLGNSTQPPSESAPQVITTAKATPNATKSGDTTVRLGTSHAIQITVAGPNGTVTPSGSVQLTRGSAVLGNASLVSGVANFSIALERGAHDVTATYSGDANFTAAATTFTLTVLQNAPLAIDARGLANAISIRAVLPPGTSSITLFRRVAGTGETWAAVGGWTEGGEFDPTSPTRGVLYDYRLDAIVSGSPQSSNIDSAILLHDDALGTGQTTIQRRHFNELRDAINALRSAAGLGAFDFDPTYMQPQIRASHVNSMRTALTEARAALGMLAVTFTDPSLTVGTPIKAAHIQEIREAAR